MKKEIIYCKYCNTEIQPVINTKKNSILCPICKNKLAPLDEVIEHGSYTKWYEYIDLKIKHHQNMVESTEQMKEYCYDILTDLENEYADYLVDENTYIVYEH